MSNIDLKGKVAVVTGASQGLGEALAKRLDREGCKVAVCDINYDGAKKVADQLSDSIALAVDVTKFDQLEEAAKAVVAKWGTVDILVSNAAIVKSGDIFSLSPEAFKLVTDINLNVLLYRTVKGFINNGSVLRRYGEIVLHRAGIQFKVGNHASGSDRRHQ